MAVTATIFDLVSVDLLTYVWVDWSDFFCGLLRGDCRKVPFDDECCRYTHHQSSTYSTSS
jgi:hypothetical protein